LFFDEADALFSKRSSVKDAHDRYANREVNYILQKLETYSGVVILSGSFKCHLDKGFVRRFQTVIHLEEE
jgi:SpoVK/Ycf46/Vps4 family AAA+-type ATPase